MVNYFKVLNILYTDDENVIKRAFYKRVKELHPDTGNYNPTDFNLLIEAYRTLVDKKKREEYIRSMINSKSKEDIKIIDKSRIIFPNNLGSILKKVRIFDRRRYKDIKKDFNVDLYVLIDQNDTNLKHFLDIDLPARIICPACFGNDRYCSLCNGIGSITRSFKYKIILEPPFFKGERKEVLIKRKIKGGEFLIKKIIIGILLYDVKF